MPVLEVRRRGGAVESHPLTPEAQVLVGRLPPADILIQGPEIQPIHCRFTLRRSGCEVTSVNPDGVDCNGTLVFRKYLTHGDTIRLGDTEIVLVDESAPLPQEAKGKSRSKSRKAADEAPLANVFQPVATERAASPPVPPAAPTSVSAEFAALDEELSRQRAEQEALRKPEVKTENFAAQLKETFGKPQRPGEQELLRSPLVLGLTLGSLILIVVSASLWLILGRESTARQYAAGVEALEAGRFTEGISALETFVAEHPGDARSKEAAVLISRARVDQLVSGATPDWPRGLEALGKFLERYRDDPDFQSSDSVLRRFLTDSATKIAEGAARSAGQSGKRPLLAVSADAQKVVERYLAKDKAEKLLLQLDQAREKAEADVLRLETYDAAIRKLDQALKADKTLAAMGEYKSLVLRYPAFSGNKPLKDRLKSVLDREQKRATREAAEETAVPQEQASPAPALALIRRTRDRADRTSAGETVVVLVDDACHGLDSVTGDPRFRRTIGPLPSFFPLAVPTATPGWLLFDSVHRELIVINRSDGKLQWRLKLTGNPTGPPLVVEGQVYLALITGDLLQVDLGSGKVQARVHFGQRIAGPPVLSPSGERLYVAGHESVLYVVARHPLGCERAAYLGHGPGAIAAPLLLMRHYLLVPENDRVDSSRLRVLKVVPEDQVPAEIDSERVAGQVRDACLLRGRQLFVPSVPERVSAFTISETDDAQAMVHVADQQVQSAVPSRMFLAAGPDDQLWMASTGLRRFQLTKDSLLSDGPRIAAGSVTQPLQSTGDALFVARRLPYSRAVFVTEADRQRMIGEWQATVGAAVIGVAVSADKTLTAVTGAGDVFRIAPERLTAGGFDVQPFGALSVGENPTEPLHATALADGTLAVWSGGKEPRLYQVGGETPVRTLKPPGPLQADPILLGDGWLLPVAGKLQLAFRPNGQPAVEDWLLQIGKQTAPKWRGVLRVDDRHAIATSSDGRVARVQWNEGDRPHLSEVVHWEAAGPIDIPPVLTPAGLVVIDSRSQMTLLDPSSLEPREKIRLNGPVFRLSAVGDHVFVELRDKLSVYSAISGQPAKPAFDVPLASPLAGPPAVHKEGLVIALQEGTIQALDATGKPSTTVKLHQALGLGPRAAGDMLLVGGVDGTVVRVDELFHR